ncbi:tail fiber domain-containing protein [Bdellovibrio sp. HCB209]|uniref:tail fiber domain-containing protein n=1 Tax=Bdellovibrio sp. HCB209 TaxID=3394354 RepID=UPI0039B49CD1
MKLTLLTTAMLALFVNTAHAVSPGSLLTYEGILTSSSGTPITTSQNVTFQVLYGACVLYSESQTVVPGADGEFSVIVGTGTRIDTTNNTADRIFASSGLVNCQGASAVTMSGFATRALHINVGGTDLTPDVTIGNIPVSINSQKLADKGPSDFLQVNTSLSTTQANLESILSRYTTLNGLLNAYSGGTLTAQTATNFTGSLSGDVSGTQTTTSVDKIKGVTVDTTGLATGKILKYDGTKWAIADDSAGTGGLSSLNGLTGSAQTFATGVSGTDFTISSTGNTHTFNLPTGSSTVRGLLSPTDWATFSNKVSTTTSLVGDVSGTVGATSVDKIKGITVSTSGITSGQVLGYNGTSFVPTTVATGSGTVTTVSGTSPISVTNGSTTPTISVATATASTMGVVQVGNGLSVASGVIAADPSSFPSLVPINKGGTGASTATAAFATLSPMTTKGDLISFSAVSPAVLPVGSTGQVLTVDSATSTGIKWATPIASDISTVVGTGIVQRTGAGTYTTLGTSAPLSVTGSNIVLSYGTGLTVSGSNLVVDSGTTAGKIVTLDATAKLPAVDGSALTNVAASSLTSTLPISMGGTGSTSKAPAFNALSPLASKGDLLASDGTTNTRLPAAANGQLLVTDSAETTGLKWIVPNFFANGGNSFGANASLGTNDAYNLGLKAGGTERITILPSGKVGIGDVSPTYNLDVNSSSTAGTALAIKNSSSNGSFTLNVGAASSSTTPAGAFSVVDQQAGKARFIIDTTGAASLGGGSANLVGISTGPGVLTLNGPGTTITDVGSLEVNNSTATITGTTMSGRVNFTVSNNGGSASTRGLATIQAQADGSGGANGYGGKLTFTTKGDNSTSSGGFFTMASNGNIGIGAMIAPAYKLDVIGDVNVSSGSVYRVNGVQICSAAGCTSSSDRNLKENIEPLDHSLDSILRVQGVTYNYIDKATFSDKKQIGVIAQDVEQVFPEVVVTDPKTGLKSVAYDHLVAPLIEAVKSLYAKITSTEEKVAEQDRKIASIESSKADRAEMDKLKKENEELRKQNEDLQKDLNLIKQKLGL